MSLNYIQEWPGGGTLSFEAPEWILDALFGPPRNEEQCFYFWLGAAADENEADHW